MRRIVSSALLVLLAACRDAGDSVAPPLPVEVILSDTAKIEVINQSTFHVTLQGTFAGGLVLPGTRRCYYFVRSYPEGWARPLSQPRQVLVKNNLMSTDSEELAYVMLDTSVVFNDAVGWTITASNPYAASIVATTTACTQG